MKLKCTINDKEYDIVQGATFKEEYNETLDSGSIMIDHVSQMKIKPYDDVFIYEDSKNFKGYLRDKKEIATFGIKVEKEVSNRSGYGESIDISNEFTVEEDAENNCFYILGSGVKQWAYYFFNFTSQNENDAKTKIDLLLEVDLEQSSIPEKPIPPKKAYVYIYGNDGKHSNKSNYSFNFSSSGEIFNMNYDVGYYDPKNERIVLFKGKIISTKTPVEDADGNIIAYDETRGKLIGVSIYNAKKQVQNVDIKFNLSIPETKKIFRICDVFSFNISSLIVFKCYADGYTRELKMYVRQYFPNNILVMKANDSFFGDLTLTFETKYENNEPVFKSSFTNKDLDIEDINLIYFPAEIHKEFIQPKGFYKHFLVNNFNEEIINIEDGIYKYKIDLMSETKGLEKVQLPNLSITPPLNINKRWSVYKYAVDYIKRYSPKIKKIKNAAINEWEYASKYAIDPNLEKVFENVYAPEMTLNAPTLKDILSRLFVVKDMIPYVKDDMIYALDITQRHGEFNLNGVNYINGSMTSENYAGSFRRNYSDALSQDNTINSVENIGFRNIDTAMLTIDNMRLELNYPIYKLNKVYLCYYKKISVINAISEQLEEKAFICKQDITPLVLENSVRNALTKDWTDFEDNPPIGENTMSELSKYRVCTLGYSKGSRYIIGWGEKYSYAKTAWIDETKIYIANILKIIDKAYPYGIYSLGYISSNGGFASNVNLNWDQSIITPFKYPGSSSIVNKNTAKVKSFFFQVDYKGFYNGAVLHSKDGEVNENIVANDNSSSSLTLLESDGNFEKEKINRFGNKTITFNARYDKATNIDVLNVLGSVYSKNNDDDVVIYSREYSVWDNGIFANYVGTKDYVMKNYFTSVWSKHRTYNLMSYGESVNRAENVLEYLVLSKNKLFYEKNNEINFRKFSDLNEQFVSALIPSPNLKSKSDFDENKKINSAFFRINQKVLDEKGNPTSQEIQNCFFSDWTTFVCGKSLCFNISMKDNATSGTYIDQINPTITGVNDEALLTGSTQKWHMIVDDPQTGRIEKPMSINFAQLDKESFFGDKVFEGNINVSTRLILEKYYPILLKFPKSPFDLIDKEECRNLINVNLNNLYKDNKERIDVTLQFDAHSVNSDIQFSEWFLKLNDLLQNYNKVSQTYKTEVLEGKGEAIIFFAWAHKYSLIRQGQAIVFRMNNTTIPQLKVGSAFARNQFRWFFDDTESMSGISTRGALAIELLEIVDFKIENGVTKSIFVKIKWGYSSTYKIDRYVEDTLWKTVDIYWQPEKVLEFTLSSSGLVDSQKSDFEWRGNLLKWWWTVPKIYVKWENGYVGCENTSDLNYNNSDVSNSGIILEPQKTNIQTYNQNMFIWLSKNELDKNLIIKTLAKKPDDFIELDSSIYPFSSVFQISFLSSIKPHFKIDLSKINMNEIKSLQYWFYDEKSESYNFVFGANIKPEDIEKGYIDIYVSLVSKRSEDVYDCTNRIVAKNRNYLDTSIGNYGIGNYYDDLEK